MEEGWGRVDRREEKKMEEVKMRWRGLERDGRVGEGKVKEWANEMDKGRWIMRGELMIEPVAQRHQMVSSSLVLLNYSIPICWI